MLLNFKELGQENTKNGSLLIIHGLFGMLDNLMTIGRKFAEKHHVYLIDARNHGRSPWDDAHNYEAMAEDIYGFIENQNIKPPIFLFGHSMGGKAAMQFAAENPTAFQKLIVVDIAPKPYPVHHGTILEALNTIDLEAINNRNEAEEVLANYGLDLGTRQFLMKNLYRTEDGKFAWRMNLRALTAEISKIGDAQAYRTPIKQATLFVRGGKSHYIQTEDYAEIKQLFPNAQIVTIEDSGHWVHAEKPNELYEVVMNFLENT